MAARRVYLVLHHILKELSSKRLVADQRNFAQVSGVSCLWPECLHVSGTNNTGRSDSHGQVQAKKKRVDFGPR